MPSPFPGMDPYLEDPGLWPDVHHELISVARDQLTARLRPKYVVRIEERVYVSDEEDPGRSVIIPDLQVMDQDSEGSLSVAAETAGTAGAAAPVVAVTVIRDKIRESRIEILDREDRRIVTVIEILSSANKVPGARGQMSYLQKRDDILESSSHFVEIDLLRAGRRAVTSRKIAQSDYFVHVSRNEKRPKGLLWPISLRQPLPAITIPLREGDKDASLDLQSVLTTAYDRAAYDLQIDYRKEPNPPLTSELAKWAHDLLAERKLR
jgi:hypothetical protein